LVIETNENVSALFSMTGEVEVFDREFRGCDILIVVDEIVRVVEKCLCFLKARRRGTTSESESIFRVSKALVSSALASPILSMPSSTILR